MPSSLMIARWYIQTKNLSLYNSFSQPTKDISLSKIQQRYHGNLSAALITTFLLFLIKLPSYIKRYSG